MNTCAMTHAGLRVFWCVGVGVVCLCVFVTCCAMLYGMLLCILLCCVSVCLFYCE